MTSLTGASGEDFASILRSLGYRMERRPKPPEPVAAALAGSSAAGGRDRVAEAAVASDSEAGAAPTDADAGRRTAIDRMIAPAIDRS